MGLKPAEKAVLLELYYSRKYNSTKRLASRTMYSWQTVDKYLNSLHKKKFVKKKKFPSKKDRKKMIVKWAFNISEYKKLKNMVGSDI